MRNENLVSVATSYAAALGALLCVASVAYPQAQPRPYTTWRTYSGGAHSAQYSALDQINRSNVGDLEVVWAFDAGETNRVFNPIVVDGVMYVLARDDELVALDAETGDELWARPHAGPIGARGINYWQSADGSDRRLLYIHEGFLTAIDARTRAPVATFGNSGRVDLRTALAAEGWDITGVRPLRTSNPGRVFENLMIVSLPAQGAGYRSTPGDVHAYDVVTGRLRWVFHSIPHEGELGYDTWPKGAQRAAGGVHNWSELTVDEANGIAFIPFGSPRYDFYGGDREGSNLFGNSLVALDARTGERLWHQQLVHHDLWDYDLPQAPKLLTIRQDGQSIDVVAQATKHGFLFVFDRRTGEPIWPIEERPVPQSNVPGRALVTDAAVSDEAPAVRPADVHRSRHQSVLAPQRARHPARQAALLAQRRAVHAPELRWLHRDAGPQRRRELGRLGRGSDQRRALRRVEKPARDAARRAHRRGADGAHDQRSGRHTQTKRKPRWPIAQAAATNGSGPLRGAVRLSAQPDERHDGDPPAVGASHRVRLEHRRDQMARARTAA